MIPEVLIRWWNTTLRFDAAKRSVFYRILAAQIRGGLSVHQAFENLNANLATYPEARIIARQVLRSVRNGEGVAQGADTSRLLPRFDVGLMKMAEKNDSWQVAFTVLGEDAASPATLFNKVIKPNTYYLLVVTALLVLYYVMQDFFVDMAGNRQAVEGIAAYQLSLFLNNWIGLILLSLTLYLGLVLWGRTRWSGPARRLLTLFDTDYRQHVALRFTRLAQAMYQQGASHVEVLDQAREIFSNEPYVRRLLRNTHTAHTRTGMAIEAALADRLLSRAHAGILQNMAPEGRIETYAGAYAALTELLQVLIASRYQNLLVVTRSLTLSGFVLLFLIFAGGIFAVFTSTISQF